MPSVTLDAPLDGDLVDRANGTRPLKPNRTWLIKGELRERLKFLSDVLSPARAYECDSFHP